MKRRLARCVPQLHFAAGGKPSYLYTSGQAKRCNPAAVRCLYLSETEATADAEYRRHLRGTPAEHQPKLTFRIGVHLRRIIDLGNRDTLRLLGITPDDLQGNWRLHGPTRLQQLGRAIDRQRTVSAVRYPSNAAAQLGRRGWNVAIYLAALESPDSVEVLGDSPVPLEVLP
jgi:RES domain-containing protein